jgi:hypothetical protein
MAAVADTDATARESRDEKTEFTSQPIVTANIHEKFG